MDVAALEKFLRDKYIQELHRAVNDGTALLIDFSVFDRVDPITADQLLEDPEPILAGFREAAETIMDEKINVRFRNLPESRNIRIRNLRAKHLNKMFSIDATIKAASEVKPQIYEAVFECPECSAKINVPQDDNIVKKPSQCECGRRGDFSLIEKKLYDVRWLQGIEPFEITTGEQPGEIAILLKEDLTTPKMQKKSDPGARLRITGVLKELPKRIKGKLSTKMDTFIEANYAEPSEIEFEELEITPEDEKEILNLAKDPNIYEMLKGSIAPGLWGFDEIKEAIALQLFGGIKHRLPDGSHIRGNLHILLTGDPGVGKSIHRDSKLAYLADSGFGCSSIEELFNSFKKPIKPKAQITISSSKKLNLLSISNDQYIDVSEPDTEIFDNKDNIRVMSLDTNTQKIEWKPVTAFIKHKSPKKMVKIRLASGRTITGTNDHSFLTLDSSGNISSVKGNDISTSMYMPVPMGWCHKHIDSLDVSEYFTRRTNAVIVKDPIKLNKEFGYFIGLFLAEGSVVHGQVRVASASSKSQLRISKFIDSLGLNSKVSDDSINISSRGMVRFLKETCYSGPIKKTGKGSGAVLKKIPSFAFFGGKEFIQGMLSGLFSGDGYIIKKKLSGNRTKDSIAIGLTTISKDLANDTLEILSSIGIFAAIREKEYIYKNEKKICYNVYISGIHAAQFLENIQLIDKKIHVDKVSEKDSLDSVPCGNILYKIVKELGYSKRIQEDSIKKRSFAAMMRTVKRRNRIGRRRLEKIYFILEAEAMKQQNLEAITKLRKIRKLLESNVVWDKVVSIEEINGNGYVYDLFVNENNTFVVNNVAIHNSVMLKLVSSIVPRGRYVSGSGVSGAGLTATVVKNEAIGGWVLEAGALILCNKGLISIDEFDKMSRDDQIAMHEATSVETVSIAKASIVATLPAQTAVLAGANPQYGRFDQFKPIADQIQIPETLLSRFDLKFALQDRPDKTTDAQLADHIISTRTAPKKSEPLIDTNLLRKYIAYSKQIEDLELTEEASKALKEFYVDMRNRSTGEGSSIAITLRQYEALIRLAEASAKIRLDTKVRMEDAERSIRLMKHSLMQLGYDYETGTFDIDRAEGGMPASKRKKIGIVMEIIETLQKDVKEVAIDDIRAEAENRGVEGVDEVIARLLRDGQVFEPKAGFIRKV